MIVTKLRRTLQILLTVATCGAVVVGWAARHIEAQGALEQTGRAELMRQVPTIKRRVPIPDDVVRAIITNDPFYSFRGQTISEGNVNAQSPAESSPSGRVLPTLTLLGTVMTSPKDGFAVIAVEGASPMTLNVGDTLQGFILRKVRRGAVALTSPDITLELTLTAPRTGNQ